MTDHHTEAQHRLAWLRSGFKTGSSRPAFSVTREATQRARHGEPLCFPDSADPMGGADDRNPHHEKRATVDNGRLGAG